ncbi:succinylglutamate desuccinylase/aspartoacylase family protein [Hyphobacterium sp. SN044]|uniref:succinylglutamate desuccinylase/aspartoacylase domain-containing protein n=1 Tax=Hyphobacterium sp. SN044 TaxID=2912575 RepID=UPI001F013DA1|nr:succinylglutamate desuccinylase/aspartoacylase family protein [Hyphobacterium sp. SN044]MCF8880253.1 succinylglutamate desuccinylase/aspartoacylase family protein [Hyphobacterium sp. SN044]
MIPAVFDRLAALPDLDGVTGRTIRSVFPRPALIRLEGRRPNPVFIAVMQHGDETVGLDVLKRLQAWMATHPLPRSLWVFVGNVEAAEAGKRRLSPETDFNRLWAGGTTPLHAMAGGIKAELAAAKPFAAIDFHNNTGANPHYSLVHGLGPEDRHLASLFSPNAILTLTPPAMMSLAMRKLCPSVTAECGQAKDPQGGEAGFDFLMAVLHLDRWHSEEDRELRLYEITGRVEVNPEASIGFEAGTDADLELPASLEKWNFFERPANSVFARLPLGHCPLSVIDEAGKDLTARFLSVEGDRVVLKRDVTPVMLTTSVAAIRDDCLCYFMEPPEARS